MAGDWLKARHDLPTDPAVISIAARLALSEDEVVGKLLRFWIWGDQQTLDGNAAGVTTAFVDRYLGVTGFANAMQEAGWLGVGNDGISIPKFDRHISESAKQRALTAKRVAKCKARKGNAPGVILALPKEEEEKSKPTLLVDDSQPPQGNGKPSRLRFDAEHSDLAKRMFARIQDVMPGTNPPVYGKWAHQLRVMSERDGLPLAQIEKVFNWANADDFWKTNIKSPGKLRAQFPTLLGQMQRPLTTKQKADEIASNNSGCNRILKP